MLKPTNLCDKHTIPYAFTSEECPMCRLMREMKDELEKVAHDAYQKGFLAGVEAGKVEAKIGQAGKNSKTAK